MYKISDNVIFVRGKKRGLIYNFNNTSLYSVDNQWEEEIKEIFNDLQKNTEIISFLLEEQIIVSKDKEENRIIEFPTLDIKHAWVEITDKCNLNCIHCYEDNKKYIDMSRENFIKIIDELEALKIGSLQLTGGEICLHPDIYFFIKYCSGKFKHLEVYTNATQICEEFIEVCNECNAKIAFTELANNEERYNEYTRSKGMYHNYKKSKEMIISNAKDYRIGKISINSNDIISDDELPRLVGNASIALYTKEMLSKKLIKQSDFNGHFVAEVVLANMKYNYCFSQNIYIDVLQNVYPCPMERRIQHGNMKKNKLKDLIKDELKYLTKDHVNGCKDCEYRYVCKDCRPDSFNKGFYDKPWYCTYDPEHGIWNDLNDYINQMI